jgi:hypothetical protein
VKVVLGVGRGSATPVAGSADPQVISHLAVFRQARSTADTLPAAAHLRQALAGAGATSYDPSAAVLLTGNGKHAAVYGVPATMSFATLPADCNRLPQFAGAWLAQQAEATGSGPGACLISTQLEQSAPPGLLLPGAAPPKPTKTLAVARTVCHSEAVRSSYVGALGDELRNAGIRLALIPDGVSAITYALADGRQFTVPVASNLAATGRAVVPDGTSAPDGGRARRTARCSPADDRDREQHGRRPECDPGPPRLADPRRHRELLVPAASAEVGLGPLQLEQQLQHGCVVQSPDPPLRGRDRDHNVRQPRALPDEPDDPPLPLRRSEATGRDDGAGHAADRADRCAREPSHHSAEEADACAQRCAPSPCRRPTVGQLLRPQLGGGQRRPTTSGRGPVPHADRAPRSRSRVPRVRRGRARDR